MIGFSTGALALGDAERGIALASRARATAIEVSTLRYDEFERMDLGALDVEDFGHVSFHAPSSYPAEREEDIVHGLLKVHERGWPIVAHPDAFPDYELWRRLQGGLLIENMDLRKSVGQSADDLAELFTHLPEARLCLDLAHAWQVGPGTDREILRRHGHRLAEVHLSEVDGSGTHLPLSEGGVQAGQAVSEMIGPDVPVILESPVGPEEVRSELHRARVALRRR